MPTDPALAVESNDIPVAEAAPGRTPETAADDFKASMGQSEIRRTARISTIEGVFAQIYASLAASTFLTKFLVMLGATPLHFSIFSAIGQLSQLFQLSGVAATRKLTSRKGVVVSSSAVARFIPLFYGLLPLFLSQEASIAVFLALFFTSGAIQAIGSNPWIAWISDMIPLQIRGRFFARRSQVLMVAALITGYLISALIDMFGPERGLLLQKVISFLPRGHPFAPENLRYALAIVFGAGALAGLISARILTRQPERPKAVETESFWQIIVAPLRDGNFRRLLLYGLWWMLACGIGGPFWGVFMIKKLGMSLVSIQLYGTISTVASLLALRPWGTFIDHFGNKTAMRFALVLGGINPILWVFVTPQHYGLVFLEAATSGIMWSGAGIVATNFVLAIAPDEKRQVYSGVFGAFSGLAMMVTLLLSGALLPAPMRIGSRVLEPEQVLFGLGGLVRWTTQIPLSWIQEPRAQDVRAALSYFRESARYRLRRWRQRLLLWRR